MSDATVDTGNDTLLTEEGRSMVNTVQVYAVMGLAAVGAVVVTKKVIGAVRSKLKK